MMERVEELGEVGEVAEWAASQAVHSSIVGCVPRWDRSASSDDRSMESVVERCLAIPSMSRGSSVDWSVESVGRVREESRTGTTAEERRDRVVESEGAEGVTEARKMDSSVKASV